MKKIGIYGGSFDPVHNGHLAFARAASEALGLDKLILIPAADSPFKPGRIQAPAEDRLAMCRLAIQGESGMSVSDIEMARGGVSYTYDTVKALAKPGETLYMLVGSDLLPTVVRWSYAILIAQRVVLVSGWRGEGEKSKLESDADFVRARGWGVELVDFTPVSVSSTELRRLVGEGGDTRGLLPESVREYIGRKGLYLPVT